ncbi:MAG: FAD-dependent oxidoreductase, partial [Candidatus Lutacidiplasmatales archaeon]
LPDSPPGVTALPRTRAIFLPLPDPAAETPFQLLASIDGVRAASIRARRVIVATGGFDAGLLFPGSDRPGVMTAEGALSLAVPGDAPPFARALIVGGGERAALLLERFGTFVEAVVAPGAIDPVVVERASALGVPLYPRSLLRGVQGRRRVRSAHVAHRGAKERFELRCDAILLAHRRVPNAQLLFQAGVRMHWRGAGGAYFPVIDHDLTTSVPGLFAAGELAGFTGTEAIEASGRSAAEASLGRPASLDALPARVPADGPHELEGYYRELLSGQFASGKLVACACEDVLLEEIRHAVRDGYRGIEVVKRYTGVGTGLCQGRYCLPDALLLLSILEGRPPESIGYITQRPPVFPTALSTFASLSDCAAPGGS